MSWLNFFRPRPVAVRVGLLRPDHAETLARLHAEAFARPWSAFEFEGFLVDRSIRADGLFLGKASQPSGFVLSRCVLDEAEILSVALDRTVRGKGYSGRLLSHHLDALARAGVTCVHLEVEEGNAAAFALYDRHGFTQSGLRPGYYARTDGTRATAVSMTRTIATDKAASWP